MKKIFILLMLLIGGLNINAQITLEHTYSWGVNDGPPLYSVNLAISGYKYYHIDIRTIK